MDDEEPKGEGDVAPVPFTLSILPGDTRPGSPRGMSVIATATTIPAEGRGGNVTEAVAMLANTLRRMRHGGE